MEQTARPDPRTSRRLSAQSAAEVEPDRGGWSGRALSGRDARARLRDVDGSRIVARGSWKCTLSFTAHQPYSSVAPWVSPPSRARSPPATRESGTGRVPGDLRTVETTGRRRAPSGPIGAQRPAGIGPSSRKGRCPRRGNGPGSVVPTAESVPMDPPGLQPWSASHVTVLAVVTEVAAGLLAAARGLPPGPRAARRPRSRPVCARA